MNIVGLIKVLEATAKVLVAATSFAVAIARIVEATKNNNSEDLPRRRW